MNSRRLFLQSSGLLLSYVIGGRPLLLTPAQAYAAGVASQVLSKNETTTLAVLAEAIVPGALSAGIAQYIDKQLTLATDDSLLMLKYLGVSPPFADFYKSGLQAVAQAATQAYNKSWAALSLDESRTLLNSIASGQVRNWQGPPAPFFFFVLRSDACDVVYGTEKGFADINMPYRAHIKPERPW